MAYALGLGPAAPDAAYPARPRPAGILAMSGFMATVPGFAHDLQDRQGFPVCIAPGPPDPWISVGFPRPHFPLTACAPARLVGADCVAAPMKPQDSFPAALAAASALHDTIKRRERIQSPRAVWHRSRCHMRAAQKRCNA